ncbi:transcriptional regulator [Halorubrum sp. CSM-61]|uniref:transcriptional regulator n=1 Tax=Halorubrum sp. CSM-61 TaxID=2485838 RepID=UPI000F4B9581|nr:transcriptional regulator [Halorubrum sp. CSM-61]
MTESYPKSVDSEVREFLERNRKPFVTTTNVAEGLGITRQYAHDRLTELVENDEIERTKVGAKAVVWWSGD